jgi:hypothetical protein
MSYSERGMPALRVQKLVRGYLVRKNQVSRRSALKVPSSRLSDEKKEWISAAPTAKKLFLEAINKNNFRLIDPLRASRVTGENLSLADKKELLLTVLKVYKDCFSMRFKFNNLLSALNRSGVIADSLSGEEKKAIFLDVVNSENRKNKELIKDLSELQVTGASLSDEAIRDLLFIAVKHKSVALVMAMNAFDACTYNLQYSDKKKLLFEAAKYKNCDLVNALEYTKVVTDMLFDIHKKELCFSAVASNNLDLLQHLILFGMTSKDWTNKEKKALLFNAVYLKNYLLIVELRHIGVTGDCLTDKEKNQIVRLAVRYKDECVILALKTSGITGE